jgi:hypothetical protein
MHGSIDVSSITATSNHVVVVVSSFAIVASDFAKVQLQQLATI